jgi:hypothetical protein
MPPAASQMLDTYPKDLGGVEGGVEKETGRSAVSPGR